uniref:InaF motif containing 2 n=1 Tax=Callorhinchus milii TaxID=7868 RepID=A0A4W3GDP2_CALMI
MLCTHSTLVTTGGQPSPADSNKLLTKAQKTWMKLVTVFGYLLCVSMASVILVVYYTMIWDPLKPPSMRRGSPWPAGGPDSLEELSPPTRATGSPPKPGATAPPPRSRPPRAWSGPPAWPGREAERRCPRRGRELRGSQRAAGGEGLGRTTSGRGREPLRIWTRLWGQTLRPDSSLNPRPAGSRFPP